MTDLTTRFAQAIDFRQTQGYARVIKRMGWQVIGNPGSYLYLRRLGPFGIAKLQRPQVVNFTELAKLRKKHHILLTYVEPGLATMLQGQPPKSPWYVEPFAHSATAVIDLTLAQEKLFSCLDTSTRTKIRRAAKDLKITVQAVNKLSPNHKVEFLELAGAWSKRKHVIGYDTNYLNHVLTSFADKAILLTATHHGVSVAHLLLIKNQKIATAYCIFTSEVGYRLRASLLLNWEAITYAQKQKLSVFDFLGIFDPRYPKMYRRWRSFTATKMLFKPKVISFPRSYLLLGW